MGAEPVRTHRLVEDPTAGEESASLIRAEQEAERAEEMALMRRKLDGVVAFIAGPANVAMQLGWPEVGYGVVESRVENGRADLHPFKRFRTTIGYLGIALLGSHEQRVAYREAINGQHRQVRSTSESPVKYNAFNRDLQLWVASCLYYGSLDAITRMHGPLSREEELVLLRAGARFGTTLQVPAELWHRTPEEFRTYWEEGLDRIEIDDRVGDYLRGLLRVDLLPAPLARVLGPLNQWLNTGFLPEPIRDQLGLDWSERDQRRHDRVLRVLGAVSRPLPHVLRAFPINAMMWNLEIRRRLGKSMV
ncbi:oxygenase MpaB family protein [Nocardioides sp. HM23]|uniref:oxygenase MpaB family protein n=1 Tax=Nocardioides bizhenqiangii TaxID=3095076 RepID=UPI002ACA8962|nr:oxygenase MpaB family protein [Nocardioides sp. HM23]MDZ5620942.1 oxygenase MpaB family protein [Nocardioides sp. HM23]